MGLTNNLGKLSNMITSTGSAVGIAQASPAYTLDVSGTVRATDYFALTTTSEAYAIQGTLSWNSARGTVLSGKTASVYDVAIYGAAGQSLITNPTGTNVISFPSGNVGIGTTTPAKQLDVYSSATTNTAQLVVSDASSTNRLYLGTFSNGSYISLGGTYQSGWSANGTNAIANIGMSATSGASTIQFETSSTNGAAPTERMRITSAGYVLIGTSTSTGLGVSRFQLAGTSTTAQILITNTAGGYASTYSTSSDVYMGRIDNGSSTLYIGTGPLNGASFNNQLSISGSGLVSIASNVEIGNGYLSTSAGSGTSYSSRLSTVYTYPYIDTFLDSIAGTSYQSRLRFRLNTAAGAMEDKLILWYNGAITFSGLAGSGTRTVTVGSDGTLSTSSDSKLKQEDKEYPIGGLKELLQITPRAYKWLDDIEKRGEEAVTELGFFADEVAPIIPSAAPKGNDDMYGFNDRAMMAVMVKSIQELTERLNKLENK
jgi:hypothetical protein